MEKGRRITIYKDGRAVACSKSCSIDTKCKTIETSTPGDGTWRTYLPDRKEWEVSCSWLVASEAGIIENLLAVGSVVTLTIAKEHGRVAEPLEAAAMAKPDLIGATLQCLEDGEQVLLSGPEYLLRGKAIVEKCKITANVGSLVNGSFSFQGTGPLERVNPEDGAVEI